VEEGGGDSSILSPTKSISGIDVSLNVSLNATAESISLSQVPCCSVLQCVAECCNDCERFSESCAVLQCVSVCCNG